MKQIISFSRRKPQEKVPLRIAPALKEGLTLLRASLPKNVEIVDGIGGSVIQDAAGNLLYVANENDNTVTMVDMDEIEDGVVEMVWTVAGFTPGRFKTEPSEAPSSQWSEISETAAAD
mgnify:CR=1 FL=1